MGSNSCPSNSSSFGDEIPRGDDTVRRGGVHRFLIVGLIRPSCTSIPIELGVSCHVVSSALQLDDAVEIVRRSRMILLRTSTLLMRRMLKCAGVVHDAFRGATAGSVDKKGRAGPETNLAIASLCVCAARAANTASPAATAAEVSSSMPEPFVQSVSIAFAVSVSVVAAAAAAAISRRRRD